MLKHTKKQKKLYIYSSQLVVFYISLEISAFFRKVTPKGIFYSLHVSVTVNANYYNKLEQQLLMLPVAGWLAG